MRINRTRYLLIPAAVSAAIAAGAVASGCGSQTHAAAARSGTSGDPATTAAGVPPTRRMTIAIRSDSQHARRGPDGRFHDAFLPADFTVRPGQRVVVRFRNFDDAPHSFNSPHRGMGMGMGAGVGVNVVIPGATGGAPGTAIAAFTAPARAGRYPWFCALPCDPWAMAHDGFMRGYVTVARTAPTG